jgi:hypothetical protein
MPGGHSSAGNWGRFLLALGGVFDIQCLQQRLVGEYPMMKISQLFRPLIQRTRNWLFVASLIIIAYLLMDGFAYLLNPYSGRISTFSCRTDSHDQTFCTVTIYGIREIYRRTFPAEDFYQAVVITHSTGNTGQATYGILIATTQEKIDYIPAYQTEDTLENKARRINDLFVEGEKVPPTLKIHIGFNSSIYRRAILLVFALMFAFHVNPTEASFPKFDSTRIGQRRAFLPFAIYWAKYNIFVRLSFYLMIFIILGFFSFGYPGEQADFVRACGYVFNLNPEYAEFPWGQLLCYYPLLTILVLQALVQRQLLASVQIKVSAWWVAAPVLASVSLVVLSPQIIDYECHILKYLMSGYFEYDPPTFNRLAIYFLCVGFIQWLVLCRRQSLSIGWVLMPLINAMLVAAAYVGLDSSLVAYEDFEWLRPLSLLASELIPALYMAWLVSRKKPTPLSQQDTSLPVK